MAACAFCGGELRPGATFCGACGHAIEAPGSMPRRVLRPGGSHGPGRPNPRAALGIVAMGGAVVVMAALFALFGPGVVDGEALVVMLLAQLPLGFLAWAVWRGQTWARWLALALDAAWALFMLTIVLPSWRVFSGASLHDDPHLWWGHFGNVALGVVELALAAFTAAHLVRPRAPSRRS